MKLHKSKHDHTGKYFSGYSEERLTYGPFETESEARKAAEEEVDEDDPIYIGKARSAIFAEIEVDQLIEYIEEQTGEALYEDALDGWCSDVTREQKNELEIRLNRVFRCWLEEVGEKDCWNNIEAL